MCAINVHCDMHNHLFTLRFKIFVQVAMEKEKSSFIWHEVSMWNGNETDDLLSS